MHYWTDTAAGTFNYVSLVDLNTMTGAWPDLAFGMGTWSASYWIKLTNYNRLPFLCSSVGGVRPTGDYYNGGGFALGCEYNSGLPGGGGTVETWFNGGFCWAVTNGFANDQWHHIALTKGDTDVNFRVKLYVDGVPNSDAWGYAATTDSPNPWNIGQDGTGTLAQDGSGVMDDLGIWNRELTPLEVYSILQVGQNYGNSLNQVGPVKLYINQVGDQPRPELAGRHVALFGQRDERLHFRFRVPPRRSTALRHRARRSSSAFSSKGRGWFGWDGCRRPGAVLPAAFSS